MSGPDFVTRYDLDRALNNRVSPLEHELRRLQSEVSSLDRRIGMMENEMANIEGAVKAMHSGLQGELRGIKASNDSLLQVQEQTKKITLEQFVSANAQLGTANVQLGAANLQLGTANGNLGTINQTNLSGFRTLDAGIDRMAQALVQTEVIRLLHEAKEPTERVKTFATEIEQRFAKTLENVYTVRTQYDQLLGVARTEYDRKLRVIGEHIYQMYEDDFRQWAEVPLSEPARFVVELPLDLDARRLEGRRTALESRFDALGDELLEPLLEAHRTLEHTLASRFAVRLEGLDGEVAVPVAMRVTHDGAAEVLGRVKPAVRSETTPNGSVQQRLALEPIGAPEVRKETAARVQPVASSLATMALSAEQLAHLKKTLERLASERRLDPELLPGYFAYLDRYGLEIFAEQEVTAP